MIRPLLGRNIRHHRNLLLALCLGLILLETLIVYIAAQIEMGPGLRIFLEQLLPPDVRETYASQFAMLSLAGAVAFGFQHPFVLVATIAFVIVAATVPAGERDTGFLDLLIARPLPRSRYLVAVLLLMVLGAVILPLALLAGAAFGLGIVEAADELPWTRYLPSAFGLTTLLLAIGGYTLALASAARRRGTAVARSAGLTLVLFWVDFTADMWRPLQTVRWLSPFNYFEPIQAAVVPHTPVVNPLALLAVFAAGVVVALVRFQERDL